MFELVPDAFEVPAGLEHERFRLRELTVDDDVVKDFDALGSRVDRASAYADGLDPVLERAVRDWIATRWPFERVTYAERDR